MANVIIKELNNFTKIAWAEIDESISPKDSDVLHAAIKNIHHPDKLRQFYGGRNLLKSLVGIPESNVCYDVYGAPFIEHHESVEVSLSHSFDMVAAARSNQAIGVDIQKSTPKLLNISGRFMNEYELRAAQKSNTLLYAQWCWSAKEAIFKAYKKGGIDFRHHIIPNIDPSKIDLPSFETLGTILTAGQEYTCKLNYFKYSDYVVVSAILL